LACGGKGREKVSHKDIGNTTPIKKTKKKKTTKTQSHTRKGGGRTEPSTTERPRRKRSDSAPGRSKREQTQPESKW